MSQSGAKANEIIYPQIEVSGLGDYDRNSGYTTSAVDLKWKTVAFNYDRGTKICVDVMDNEESRNLAFGMAGATLMREKVAPEADAFTFATLSSLDNISKDTGSIDNAAQFLDALLTAWSRMDEDEVPQEQRILYATATLLNSVMALDTTKSREILSMFSVKKVVPQARFYTSIDLLDGKTTGEEVGHYKRSQDVYEALTAQPSDWSGSYASYYTKSGDKYVPVTGSSAPEWAAGTYYAKKSGGYDLKFLIVHKPAIIKFDKHIAKDVILAKNNPDADADIVKYRKYGLVDAYANKRAGIYAHYN